MQDAVAAAYDGAGAWKGEPELLLELRASLSSAASWAPMVCALALTCRPAPARRLCVSSRCSGESVNRCC